jgi:hypothetical protein
MLLKLRKPTIIITTYYYYYFKQNTIKILYKISLKFMNDKMNGMKKYVPVLLLMFFNSFSVTREGVQFVAEKFQKSCII